MWEMLHKFLCLEDNSEAGYEPIVDAYCEEIKKVVKRNRWLLDSVEKVKTKNP